MSAALYDTGRDAFANKLVDWVNDPIAVAFVGSGYVANMGTDQWYSSVSASVIGSPVSLTGKTTAAGVVNAASVTSGNIASGSTITQLVIFSNTGTPSTSRLIARMDVTATPTNGGTVTVSWDAGVNKVFKL